MKSLIVPVTVLTSITLCAPMVVANDSLSDGVAACAKIDKDKKRLKCFDALSRKVTATAPVQAEKKMAQQKNDFGAESLKARERSFSKTDEKGEKSPDEMIFTILEAGKNRAGNYFFIMENGQVWRQLSADSGKFRVPKNVSGKTVKIKKKLFGSHMLTLNGFSIKVKRLK